MNVVLLHSNYRHVSATHVSIFRMMIADCIESDWMIRKMTNVVQICVLCLSFAWYNQNWSLTDTNEGVTEVELHLRNRREMSQCTYRRIQDILREGSEKNWTSVVNSVDLLRQIHLPCSNTCTVILTSTRTVLVIYVCFVKVQTENHHKWNANIITAVNGCTFLLFFNLKDTILVMATFVLVYSDKFSVTINNSRVRMCRRSCSCREDTVFLHISHLEYGLYKGFCILVWYVLQSKIHGAGTRNFRQ